MHRREHLGSWRFLTFSCYKCLPLFANPGIRDAFADALRAAREMHRFRLIAWVVMPEHIHLIIVPRPLIDYDAGLPVVASKSEVKAIMWGLKKPFAQRVIARWVELRAPILARLRLADGTHHFWQPGGGFDRNIRSDAELWKEICYIHDNPVIAQIVEQPEDWAWSSARWYAGEKAGAIPIDNDHDGVAWNPPQEWIDGAVRLEPDEFK